MGFLMHVPGREAEKSEVQHAASDLSRHNTNDYPLSEPIAVLQMDAR